MSEAAPDGRTAETALPRPGARVVLLDASGRVLLVRSEFDGRSLWFTPGGALDAGESFEEAARRELREELGLDVALGPCVWLRHATWRWEERDTWYETTERFYLVRVDAEAPPLTLAGGAEEIVTLHEARWWDLDALRASEEEVSPRALLELLAPIVGGEVPLEPVKVGL